jgi:hypothetical protein
MFQRRKKLTIILIVIMSLCLLIGLWWRFGTERLLPWDCTKFETYDAIQGGCYFECDSDEQCERISAKVDKELNNYFETSESKIAPKKPVAPVDIESKDDITHLKLEDTGSETKGIVYTISKNLTLLDNPTAEHQKLWELFLRIASKDKALQYLESFEVFNDPNNSIAASVWQSGGNPKKWHMNVNEAYSDDKKDLIHTMVHEFGHIVTLNDTQVEQTAGACPTLTVPEGCTKSSSYINTFQKTYWANYGPESIDNEDQQQAMTRFESAPDDFINDYAATNSIEDLAETWAHFVLKAKPDGEALKYQKIRSLYNYPELIKERQRIRSALAQLI